MGIQEQYNYIEEELAKVCHKARRSVHEVRIVAVSKTVGLAEVKEALQGGISNFGENRPDELLKKVKAFPDATWHFIGNIQSRRIRDIVGSATLIHSLYQESHAKRINTQAARQNRVQDVLLEVNVSGEASKGGAHPNEVEALLELCETLDHVRVRGLMTMAPRGDSYVARKTFEGLRMLRDTLASQLSEEQAAVFNELSMGMSEDWREAVYEGATIVRIGRAIFSDEFAQR